MGRAGGSPKQKKSSWRPPEMVARAEGAREGEEQAIGAIQLSPETSTPPSPAFVIHSRQPCYPNPSVTEEKVQPNLLFCRFWGPVYAIFPAKRFHPRPIRDPNMEPRPWSLCLDLTLPLLRPSVTRNCPKRSRPRETTAAYCPLWSCHPTSSGHLRPSCHVQ